MGSEGDFVKRLQWQMLLLVFLLQLVYYLPKSSSIDGQPIVEQGFGSAGKPVGDMPFVGKCGVRFVRTSFVTIEEWMSSLIFHFLE